MKKLFLIILLFSFTISAQKIQFNRIDSNINNYIFNGEWQKADSLISIQLERYPDSPKYHFMKAYNFSYARFFSNSFPHDRDKTIRLIKNHTWDAIKVGEKSQESAENKFFLGSAYAHLARANIMSGETWTAYWNAGKAEDYFQEALEADPNLYDAYLNIGIAEYFADTRITGFTGFMAWLGGMSGDSDLGLDYIDRAAKRGVIFADEAKYVQALIYSFGENDLVQGHKYWSELADKFPNNTMAVLQKERTYFAKLIDEKGVKFLESEFDSLETRYGINNPGVLNTIGYNLINQNRLDDALFVFKTNIKKYPNVANGYDSIAECYLNRGENQQAIKYYKMAYEKLDSDTTITDDFRNRLKESIPQQLADLGADINT